MLQLLPGPDGDTGAATVAELAPKQFNSEQQTPILFDGHLVGIRKQDRGRLVCLDLEGKEIWNSGKDRFGHGPYMIADGVILALSNEGELVHGGSQHHGLSSIGTLPGVRRWARRVGADGIGGWASDCS